jgi:hypothetical protein
MTRARRRAHGDEIRIGSATMKFRVMLRAGTTETQEKSS